MARRPSLPRPPPPAADPGSSPGIGEGEAMDVDPGDVVELPVSPPSGRSCGDALSLHAASAPDSELKCFIEFIETYTVPGEQKPAYQDQVHNLGRECFSLEVQFDHLLDSLRQDWKHKKFLNLVLRIGNEANDSWLAPAVQELMMERGNSGKPHVSFVKKPRSISLLKDLLTDKDHPPTRTISVLGQRSLVYASTTRGRFGFRTPLLKLLSYFAQDRWFEDAFNIDDFLIIDSEVCCILKKTCSLFELCKLFPNLSPNDASKAMAAAKARNLASLWQVMEKFYVKNSKLPIYFSALKGDMLHGTLDIVNEAWFLTYLAHHFSFTSSMCRKFFTTECYQVCKTYTLGQDSSLESILITVPSIDDWRLGIMLSNDYILNRCFWHGAKLDGDFKTIAELIKHGEFHRIHLSQYERACANTVGAVLDYKTHLLRYLEEHCKKRMRIYEVKEEAKTKGQLMETYQTIDIKDADEIELFASGALPQVEPLVLKHIMEKNMKDFESVVSWYKASISDKKDLPSC